MKKSVIAFFIVFTALISCKKEQTIKDDESTVSNKPVGNDYFVVTMDVVAQKNDSFHIYFSEDGTENFIEENSIWCEFKGSPNSQKLLFKIPEDRIPNEFRLDFGINKEQGDVKINNVEITYRDKVFNISGSAISNYFKPNEVSTSIDIANQTIKPIKPGINTSLYPTEALRPELEKLLK